MRTRVKRLVGGGGGGEVDSARALPSHVDFLLLLLSENVYFGLFLEILKLVQLKKVR